MSYITFSWWIIGNTDLVCQYCLINHRFIFEVIISHMPEYQNLFELMLLRKSESSYPLSVWWEISKWKLSSNGCATSARSAKLLGWNRTICIGNVVVSKCRIFLLSPLTQLSLTWPSHLKQIRVLFKSNFNVLGCFQTDVQTNRNRGVEVTVRVLGLFLPICPCL